MPMVTEEFVWEMERLLRDSYKFFPQNTFQFWINTKGSDINV